MKIASEMANAGTVVPICSAMGFAFVLRLTECDQHLVRLLARPLRRLRVLLVPGGILAGYLINTTIVSQAATAAVLGPILIPLLRAGGLGSISAGAILLLGSSMGGELFNPGSVEMRKLSELTGHLGAQVVGRSARLNLLACATAAGAFWLLSVRRRENNTGAGDGRAPAQTTDDVPRACRLNLSRRWYRSCRSCCSSLDAAFGPFLVTRAIEGPARILAAMLIGVVAAGLTSFRTAGGLSSAFFDGAGLRVHPRHLAHRGGLDIRRGNPAERADRDHDPCPGSLAGGRDGRGDGGPVEPGVRVGNGDRAGDRDHGVLRAGRRPDGHRPGPAGHA